MSIEDNRAEIADGSLLIGGVERDLGAEIGRVNDADVILRRADVAGILEGDPWVAGLKEHREHAFPEIEGFNLLTVNLPLLCQLFVAQVGFLELFAVELVQVLGFVGAEQSPALAGLHALHEQIGNPVGGVHVVRAAAVVAGVLAQLEELQNVVVPGLEVGAAGALALAALVDGDELVIVEFEERDDALRLAIGATDVGAGAADSGP